MSLKKIRLMNKDDRHLAIQFAESLQAASGTPLYDASHRSELADEAADWCVELAKSSLGGLNEEDEAELRSSLREKHQNAAIPQSRYEDPSFYSIVEHLTIDLNEGARMRGLVPARWPVIGTLDTGRVNAVTVRVPGTMECVIFLERQLLAFANLFSKAIARALPIKQVPEGIAFGFGVSDVVAHVRSDWSTAARLGDLLIAYVATGLPMHAQQYFCEPSHVKIASYFRHSMELFVLGHEYAHVMLGDMADAGTKPGLIAVG